MELKEIKVQDIVPYENNPRFNDNGVDAVKNSIKEFDYLQPIVLDENNVVLIGHTRLKALKALGIETVQVVYKKDLTESQKKALRLADNKTSELSEWDFSKLEEELKDIDIDMVQFGFEEFFGGGTTFNSEVADKEDSEFEEKDEQYTTCPNCGMQFVPIFE